MRAIMMTRTLGFLAGLLLVVHVPALAHEKGAIRLGTRRPAAGDRLALRGEHLPKDAALTLELRGALKSYRLGAVRTDGKGLFTSTIALPAEAGAGTYRVVAIASDGDKTAEAELTIVAATAATPEHEGMHAAPNVASAPHATAEMMRLPVSWTGVEMVVVAVIVGACLAGGVRLLARTPSSGA